MISKNLFITGANRGIGKGILEFYLKNNFNPQNIFVGVRNVDEVSALFDNEKIFLPKKNLFYLDLEKNDSIDNFVQDIKSQKLQVI